MDDFFSTLRPGMTIIESIYELLSLFLSEESLAELFEGLDIKRGIVVVDTNVFLSDLKYFMQKKHHTGLMAAAKIGGLRLFASTSVRDEVPEKLEISLSKYGIDAREAERVWYTYYAPWIDFLDPSELPPLSSKVRDLLARDPDDFPTGQIIELLGPHLVLTRDEDLAAFESTGHDIPIITCAYRDKTKQEAVSLGVSLGGGFVFLVSSEAIKAFFSLLSRVNKALPVVFLLLAAGSLGIAFAYPPSRKWIRERGSQTLVNLWKGIEPLLNEFLEIEAASARAKLIVSQPTRIIGSPRTARDYAVKVLIEAFGPLGVKELTRRMILQGYETSSEHPEYYVSKVLRKYPRLFVRNEIGRWQLRSHLPKNLEEAI